MTWIFVAAILIVLGVALYLLRGRFAGESRSEPSRASLAAPRLRVSPGTRGRCPKCGARRWPGAVKCWNCGHDEREV